MPARLMRRRWLLASVPTLLLASAAGRAAGGDLAVNCDTTLAPALRKVADAYKARFGGHVFIFPTGPGLILPQLVRDIQNDIVVTQTAILEQAAQAGVIAAPVRAQWRNPLVIAGPRRCGDDGWRICRDAIRRRRRISMAPPCWRALPSSRPARSAPSIPMRLRSC